MINRKSSRKSAMPQRVQSAVVEAVRSPEESKHVVNDNKIQTSLIKILPFILIPLKTSCDFN